MKLTKRKAIKAVADVLGWRANPALVTVEDTDGLPTFTMQVGKMLVEVGTASSLTGCQPTDHPEKYGLRTMIYMEFRLPCLAVELLDTRFFFLDTLEEAWAREEYNHRMDAVEMCDGLRGFDIDSARAAVDKYERRDAISEERQAPNPAASAATMPPAD